MNSIVEIERVFAQNAMQARSRLRQWKDTDPANFLQQTIELLKRGEDTGFTHMVLQLCREDRSSLQELLFTSDLLSLDESARLVHLVTKNDPNFQVDLVASVKAVLENTSSNLRSEELTRFLEILVSTVDAKWMLPFLSKLCEHSDERIRSKAVLLTGRVARSLPRNLELLCDLDPRVRANAVESLWTRKDLESIQFFREAVNDPNHRVSANALLGLYWAGEITAAQGIGRMATDPDPMRQLAGFWLMGQTRDSRYMSTVKTQLTRCSGQPRLVLIEAQERIRSRREEILSRPPLQVQTLRAERKSNGRLSLSCLVFSDTGQLLAPQDLLATNVVVHDGDLRVDYFRWTAHGGSAVWAGFLIPAESCIQESFALHLARALAVAMEAKRVADEWAIQRYRPQGGEDTGGATASLAENVKKLFSEFPATAFEKHLVVILGTALELNMLEEILHAPHPNPERVVVHLLYCGMLPDDELARWAQICAAGNGTFLLCRDVTQLPETLRSLVLSLQCKFSLTYCLGRLLPSVDGPAPVQVELFSELGYGKIFLRGHDLAG
ncbi:HEAT repeat domain-containing protein [Bryobacter aggregatus]|uniref:HEAT repeat domain-containing protein n=1 Tax=Bryobacter aggregatus TaxID=360054 RepID=UPI0004E222EF|nr:HEAT repeat domain-containing protein [Bryobacter aggregatus]